MHFSFRLVTILFIFGLISTLFISPLLAWPVIDGVAICTAANQQEYPLLISDGSGGAIIVWMDNRNTNLDIYAQRVNNTGHILWDLNGVAICTAVNDQFDPYLTSDGVGGAIITWMDNRSNTDYDIYAQRINSAGSTMWAANGVAICTARNSQLVPQLVSDESGGAIITWFDHRDSMSAKIYAQRVNSEGSTLWSVNGVTICTATGGQGLPKLVSDGLSGAIIVWEDYRNDYPNNDIYAQRINSIGSTLWDFYGVPICTAGGSQEYPRLVSDGLGGAIITWNDHRNDYYYGDVYAQRVNSIGSTLWALNGVAICTDTEDQYYPKMISDGVNGAIISWEDYRSGTMYSDIYTQRINSIGSTQWMLNGVAICTGDNHQFDPELASDGSGGAIITWTNRSGSNNFDIYAQRVNNTGQTLWTTNGMPISPIGHSQGYAQIIPFGSGGAVIVWEDARNGPPYPDIYAQQIYAHGLPVSVPKELWELY